MASVPERYEIKLNPNLFPDPAFSNEKGYDSFFSLYHTTVSDRTFNDLLSSFARLLLIECIRLAYKMRSTCYTIDARLLPRWRGVTTLMLLSELSNFNYIEPLKEDKKNEIREDKNNSAQSVKPEQFDFEIPYAAYPLKKGKTPGFRKLARDVKTEADFENLKKASSNYAEEIRLNNTPAQYTKHFSTFAGQWRDWVDFVPSAKGQNGQPLTDHFASQAQRLGVVK